MVISTRGRYALRVMINLAEHGEGNRIALKDIAKRQGVSIKYMERIMSELTKAHLLEGHTEKAAVIVWSNHRRHTASEIF